MVAVDYDFATLDLADDSEAAVARRSGWLGAVQRGFHGGRPEEEFDKRWLAHVRADGAVCSGAWLPEGEFGAGPSRWRPSATSTRRSTPGHELVPLRMITDVTTSPAHRRRGLVRRLMEASLEDAVGCRDPGGGAHRQRGDDLRPLGLRRGDLRPEDRGRHRPALRAARLRRPGSRRAHRAARLVADRQGRLRPVPRREPRIRRLAAVLRGAPHRRLRLRGRRPGQEAARGGPPRRRRHRRRRRALQGRRPRATSARSTSPR